jgi:hypothetical protein
MNLNLDLRLPKFKTQLVNPHKPEEELVASASQQRMASLSATRNANVSPLLRLYPEILARVFYFLQCSQDSDRWVSTPWINFDAGWIRYTLVCRRLRDVALSTPSLWTLVHYDYLTPLYWLDLCVARAQSHPLDIAGVEHLLCQLGDPPYTIPRPYLARAGKMEITLPSDNEFVDYEDVSLDPEILPMLLEDRMPAMQHLWMHMAHRALPATLLGGHSASLTRLALKDVRLTDTEPAPAFPALRSLDLSITDFGRRGRQLIALLARSPELETLVIQTQDEEINFSAACLQLPRLTTLWIQSTCSGITSLIHLVPVPSHRLHIDVHRVHRTRSSRRQPPESLDSLDQAHDFVSRFCKAATREEAPPATEIEWLQHAPSFATFGKPFSIDEDAGSPRLFFRTPAGTVDDVSLLLPLDAFEGVTFHFPVMMVQPAVPPLRAPPALRVLCPAVRRVCLRMMPAAGWCLPSGFAEWVRERADAGRRLEVVEFSGCFEAAREYARTLEESGLVGSVLWTPLRDSPPAR